MRSRTELAREIQLSDWSTAGSCLTGPSLEYKYRVIFVLILGVILISFPGLFPLKLGGAGKAPPNFNGKSPGNEVALFALYEEMK